ncbi:hypothetical protein M408DRAFT_78303, partial [Serendipita vermifera MAFF 305830]
GGLFGTQPAAGGAAGGGGLFGAKPATPTLGGGLFGQTQPAGATGGTGLFGSTNPAGTTTGGGLFGSTQPAAGTTGGGLFGSTTTQPATGGGLFGSNQPATGGGLFGQPAGASTGGLFGQSTATTGFLGQQQQQPKPGGLFGQPAAPTTGGLFGQPAAKPGGLFGNSTTTGFGLGNSMTPSSGFGFGGGTAGFGATQNQPQQQQQQPQGGLNAQGQALLRLLTQLSQLQQGIQGLMAQGAMGSSAPSGHQESLETYVFYNVVDPVQVAMYARPSHVSDALWEKAIKENPDPRCMVPAFAMGMEDLQKRADAQAKATESCKAKLDEIRTKLATLSQRHVLSTSLRSQKLSNNHILLFQRVVRLSQHLHLLIPSVRSSAIRPEEEHLRGRLEATEDELRRGNASKGRMNEMWGVVGQLTALKTREGMETGGEGKEWAVVDEEGLRRLSRILSEQQHGLAHLTRILQDSLRELTIILTQLQPGGPLSPPS